MTDNLPNMNQIVMAELRADIAVLDAEIKYNSELSLLFPKLAKKRLKDLYTKRILIEAELHERRMVEQRMNKNVKTEIEQ